MSNGFLGQPMETDVAAVTGRVSTSGASTAACLASLLLLIIAFLSPLDARADNSRFIPPVKNSTNVVVFIHGLTGDAKGTWTNEKAGIYWPKMMKGIADFEDIDIFVYEYPSSILSPSNLDVSEIARDLAQTLRFNNIDYTKNIVFLAHSLGGVVVRALLAGDGDYFNSTVSLHLYGTPTNGAGLTRIARYFSSNPQVKNISKLTDNTFLKYVQDVWRTRIKKDRDNGYSMGVYCAYEKKKYGGVIVVDRESATALCDESFPIEENHVDMVKPTSDTDKSQIFFLNSFRDATRKLADCRRHRDLDVQARAWDAVDKSDPEAIDQFLSRYPCTAYIHVAQGRLEQLREKASSGQSQKDVMLVGLFLKNVVRDDATGRPAGSEIQYVLADTPAAKAGLERKDVITRVNRQPVASSHEVTEIARQSASGSIIEYVAWRSGKTLTFKVTLTPTEDG